MTTFFMLGKYSAEAVKEMSAERTEKGNNLIRKFGGKVISIHAMLGEYDLIFIVDFPGIEDAMKASAALSKLTGISFITLPSIDVRDFDRMMTDI